MNTLSSSPFALASMENAITGAGSLMEGIEIGWSRSASQSPARVSFSFATAPMSPGPNASVWVTSLPCGTSSCPMRSLAWARVLSTCESWVSVPW